MNLRKGDIAGFEDVLTELLSPTDEMIEAMRLQALSDIDECDAAWEQLQAEPNTDEELEMKESALLRKYLAKLFTAAIKAALEG